MRYTYEPQTEDSYKPEYGVRIRRFTELLAKTGPANTKLGSAVSYIQPGESVQEHQHPVTELLFLINGKARVRVEDTVQEMSEGDVIVIEGDQVHQVSNAGDEPIRFFSFWWSEPEK
ncbi:cupin domain-containing protein [Kitasatospora viridis]|uniref:Quercetin dioxygenase-like cupin family protein n=1 Tax=Kitasatospora viridis TaxID=281105 RepID=A0A561UCS8_9ACTN|nr:cupin domain-containing protein [Kitasatospora viridis]TWF97151.1 quercetin dioxygenase-like cupin family protein [Kitasatospora viridis]